LLVSKGHYQWNCREVDHVYDKVATFLIRGKQSIIGVLNPFNILIVNGSNRLLTVTKFKGS